MVDDGPAREGDPIRDADNFSYSLKSLTFSDSSTANLPPSGVVVFVGPNNGGKSQALHDIAAHIGVVEHKRGAPTVRSIQQDRVGSADAFFDWLTRRARLIVRSKGQTESLGGVGFNIATGDVRAVCAHEWSNPARLQNLGRAVAALLDTATRLSAANPVASFDTVQGSPSEPIQGLFDDRTLELRVSGAFRQAYNLDLVVGRHGGSKIHLHVGAAPDVARHGPELGVPYQKAVRELPLLHEQGDGMRSFAACLLYADVVDYPILLIDEPEAFLHPAQARVLAQHLAGSTRTNKRQLFVATHSGDLIRGLLDSGQEALTVIRLRREGSVNAARHLDAGDVRALWSDPALRVSNILDGLFHEHVCLCEADTDVRFYGAVLEAVCDARARPRPDVMFCHCNGKHRMANVVRALGAVGSSVVVIGDIDLLDGEKPLREIWEALGRQWDDIEKDHRIVHQAVLQQRNTPAVADVRERIQRILAGVADEKLTAEASDRIRAATKVEGGWQIAKRAGEDSLPKGDARRAYTRLTEILQSAGLFLVPVGEIEGFLPDVGRKGPAWVNEAIKYDLAHASELTKARAFLDQLPFMSTQTTA